MKTHRDLADFWLTESQHEEVIFGVRKDKAAEALTRLLDAVRHTALEESRARAEKAEEGWIKAEARLGNCCPLCGWDPAGCRCIRNMRAARKLDDELASVSDSKEEKPT